MKNHLIVRDPEILSGIPIFYGTRVPVKNLIDYLEAGQSLEEFLDDFPTVKKEDVLKFLKFELGSGDYSKDRHQWLVQFTVDDIFNQVQEQRENSVPSNQELKSDNSMSARGKFKHLPNSSEDFARRKQEEIDWEDRNRV
jgi:uncharacterized protein (DUF433 family)